MMLFKFMIPNYIKHIYSYDFQHSRKFIRRKFQTINESAFEFSSIENFIVLNHVTYVAKLAFSNCTDLQIIDFNHIETMRPEKLKKKHFE